MKAKQTKSKCRIVEMFNEKTEKNFQRKLKVYKKFFLRPSHELKIFPEIRLCGKWLKDLGFECGRDVLIQHEQNKITITIKE